MFKKFNKNWETQTRNNAFELKMEIQRVWDYMQTLTLGSPEYEKVLKVYDTLLAQEKELKKIDADVSKFAWGAIFTVGGWCLYRACFDKVGDPFFKEIGKNFIKIIPHV